MRAVSADCMYADTPLCLDRYESLCPSFPGGGRLVLLALSLGLMQQLTGTEAILYYAPQILAGK